MFKKILILIIAVIAITGTAAAKNTYTRNASALPKAAQTTLANNFKSKISVIKIDKDFGRVSDYEVILTDGAEITFDRNGNWKNVEVGTKGSVPAAFIPEAVAAGVKEKQPGQKIIGIEKERGGYEVQLSNGVEMKFNKQGRFLRYED